VAIFIDRDRQVYVTLVKTNSNSNPPQALQPIAIGSQPPTNLSAEKLPSEVYQMAITSSIDQSALEN
jgi:hypothetical protein